MDLNDNLLTASYANLHFVTPTLAIGGDVELRDPVLAGQQLDEIAELGITHVVDCRLECSDEKLFAQYLPELGYLHHGMDDAGQRVPGAWFDQAIAWIDAAGPDAVVLIHCHMGINRGPSLGYAVLLHQGWDPVDALAAIRGARPQANAWYAEDALRWHHARQRTSPAGDLRRVAAWRDANPLDVVRLIRAQRLAGR